MGDQQFERARRRAAWQRVIRFLTGKPSLLVPFELVRRQVGVGPSSYAGIREVEIDKIIGSVNRYAEFDRAFLPSKGVSPERWSRVRQLFEGQKGFEPISVYQVGEAYFVVDGNHRVSVARHLGLRAIEAEITRFTPPVPIDEDTDIPSLIIKSEYSAFLRKTRLGELRPMQRIEFTRPGRYTTLLEHIDKRRYFMSQERGREIEYEEAVTSWYDGLYRPLVEIFQQERLLERFPGRTEADLYVWITNHLYYLREQYGDDVGLDEATRDFVNGRRSGLRRLAAAPGRRHRSGPTEAGTPALDQLEDRLRRIERQGVGRNVRYRVPRQWTEGGVDAYGIVESTPVAFWKETVERIRGESAAPVVAGESGDWSRFASVFNLFVRASCAFDHDGDGRVAGMNRQGVRETGTFMKAMSLLPYVRDLGCDVIHLLPVCRIGRDGAKGSLGSPYAIADQHRIEDTLAEPLLGLGPEAEFRAFVEAAHRIGLRVVVEMVLRTAAKDSVWVAEHPEWFYWIRDNVPNRTDQESGGYGNPRFTPDEIRVIKARVSEGRLDALVQPAPEYRDLFVPTPQRDTIRREGSRWEGRSGGRIARIPGAFVDWPPDDPQPPWSDVTYLRLFEHPDYNYIAYDTIRMYAAQLAKPEHVVADLWECIAGILPHYQSRFGIDGAMIDMGHALPPELKARIIAGARGVNPGFGLWDEDFSLRAETRRDGYNAAIGNLWWMIHRPERFKREFLGRLASDGVPLPFFSGPETHNTPRCAAREGGAEWSRLAWIVAAFLPGIPFVHSGFELSEVVPVNTGLDFGAADASRYPPARLPLYSEAAYDWDGGSQLRRTIRDTLAVRRRLRDLICDADPGTFLMPGGEPESVVTYARGNDRFWLLVVANPTGEEALARIRDLPADVREMECALSGRTVRAEHGRLRVRLGAWEGLVLLASRGTSEQ